MILVIHGPAGSGKSTTCKLLVKDTFRNKSAYYDLDHVTREGTQPQRCQQVVEMIKNHPGICKDYHYFVNWVFESPRVMADLISNLDLLTTHQEVRGLILSARSEIRMARLENRRDRDWVREQSEIAAQSLDENFTHWSKIGPMIDTSDDPETVVGAKVVSYLQG